MKKNSALNTNRSNNIPQTKNIYFKRYCCQHHSYWLSLEALLNKKLWTINEFVDYLSWLFWIMSCSPLNTYPEEYFYGCWPVSIVAVIRYIWGLSISIKVTSRTHACTWIKQYWMIPWIRRVKIHNPQIKGRTVKTITGVDTTWIEVYFVCDRGVLHLLQMLVNLQSHWYSMN